jgi:hypothetical protein
MGDIADSMLEGDVCAGCGGFIDDQGGDGFPRYCCAECDPDGEDKESEQRARSEHKKIMQNLADKLNAKLKKEIEKHFDAEFEDVVWKEFASNTAGLFRKLYVDGTDHISHHGLIKTIQVNRAQAEKAAAKQKKRNDANAKR